MKADAATAGYDTAISETEAVIAGSEATSEETDAVTADTAAAVAHPQPATSDDPAATPVRGVRALARADALDRLQKREDDVRDLRLTSRLVAALVWAVQAFWGGPGATEPLLVMAIVVTALAVVVEVLAAVRLRGVARVRRGLDDEPQGPAAPV